MSSDPPSTTSINKIAMPSSKSKPFFDPSLFTQPRSKPSPPGAKTFLDLPIELRLIIYEYATADLFPYDSPPIKPRAVRPMIKQAPSIPDGAHPIPNLAIALANYRICTEHLMAAIEAEKKYWLRFREPIKPLDAGLRGLSIQLSRDCLGVHVLETLGVDVVDRFDYIIILERGGASMLGIYEPFGPQAPLGPRWEALEGNEYGSIRRVPPCKVSKFARMEDLRWKQLVEHVGRHIRRAVEAAGGPEALGWEGEAEAFWRRAIFEKVLQFHDARLGLVLCCPRHIKEQRASRDRRSERYKRMEFSFVRKRVRGLEAAMRGLAIAES